VVEIKGSNQIMETTVERTVVIVGGGVMGLSTAYFTSLATRARARRWRVVVVDAAAESRDTSSDHNTGCVNGIFPEGPGHQLAEYSYNIFRGHRDRSDQEHFRRFTRLKGSTIFKVSDEDTGRPGSIPGWFNAGSNLRLVPQPEDGSSMTM
jgi:glycine/D-amino acid oxidase-like deaminating enzyme